jgi:hypothetical protein
LVSYITVSKEAGRALKQHAKENICTWEGESRRMLKKMA